MSLLLLFHGTQSIPPPVIIIDSHDPGEKRRKRFEDEAARRKRNRDELVAAYEWAVEGKPRLAAEVAFEFASTKVEPDAPIVAAPQIDFTKLLADYAKAERLWTAYQDMLEQDDEDVLVLLN